MPTFGTLMTSSPPFRIGMNARVRWSSVRSRLSIIECSPWSWNEDGQKFVFLCTVKFEERTTISSLPESFGVPKHHENWVVRTTKRSVKIIDFVLKCQGPNWSLEDRQSKNFLSCDAIRPPSLKVYNNYVVDDVKIGNDDRPHSDDFRQSCHSNTRCAAKLEFLYYSNTIFRYQIRFCLFDMIINNIFTIMRSNAINTIVRYVYQKHLNILILRLTCCWFVKITIGKPQTTI